MAMRLRNYNLARLSVTAIRTASTKVLEPNAQQPATSSRNSKQEDNGLMSVYNRFFGQLKRGFSSVGNSSPDLLDANSYESIGDETLESLCDKFEQVLELLPLSVECDSTLSSGVLTINLDKYGTYVINKQSPNRQIWLSSPISGPKRYDYVNGTWIYKHDGISLYDLLSKEISEIVGQSVDFSSCAYGKAV